MMRLLPLLFCCVLLLLLTACEMVEKQDASSQDVLSQKVLQEGRTPITVLVKYAFSIHAFEAAVEKKFPDIDLVQVGNYTRDRGIIEYQRRLEHDDLTDIVMTWPLDVGEEYWESRLIDLASLPFTSLYNTAMLNSIARNGKLFYLPGPGQVRGIVYNKTLFAEKGWKVPHDFDSFVALCKQIEASGMRSFQLGFGNGEVLDTAFVGYNYGNFFSTPMDAQWLADYNQGRGSFERFRSALQVFRRMKDAGIWQEKDLTITYATRERMLFMRQCAMVEDSVLLTRMGHALTGTTDEFALMPFFTPGQDNDWARIYMVCYIGLNKHLQEAKNNAKYNLVLQLMQYISSPEGQAALSADTGAMYSSVKHVRPPDFPEIFALRSALTHGRYAVFPELKRSQNALRRGLAGMLTGRLNEDDVITMVDRQNLYPQTTSREAVLGQATASFTLLETGNFITDVMRRRTGAEIALFLDNGKDGRFNGKGVSASLYKGPQTMSDVLRVLPDMKRNEKGVLQVIKMTGANLLRTLEHALAVDNEQLGWFYYFSGLRMEYAPAAQPGSRIRAITTVDGAAIDPAKLYKVAVMDETVSAECIYSLEDTGILIQDMLADAIRAQQNISPERDERFTIRQP